MNEDDSNLLKEKIKKIISNETEDFLTEEELRELYESKVWAHKYGHYQLTCPEKMWPDNPYRTMCNCPDDDAFKRFVQKHRAEYARIFFEEYEKHKKKGDE